ncbi:type IV pilin-like G/H family protein [Microcoleus sp. ARI1-B5]|uniref:type IV pilin-like G/H family protein n=1 Tax=unclassified Microcoleus TaxID=2642155 RepID=UPI002FD2DBAF
MLLNRSIHELLLPIIPLLQSRFTDKVDVKSVGESRTYVGKRLTSVRTRQCRVPTGNQLLSNPKNMIYSSRNPQMKVVITTLILSVFFATVAQAQWPPTFKAQESAAKQYVAAMNKAQQSYYANNTGFTSSVSNLGLGIKPDTANYTYSIYTENKVVFNYAVSNKANLKSFVGGVFLVTNKTQTILCLNAAPGKIKSPNPTNTKGVLECAAGTGKIAQ